MATQTRKSGVALKPSHVGISVPDIEASISWYADVLGFTVVRHNFVQGVSMNHALLQNGDFCVEIFDNKNPLSVPKGDGHFSGVDGHLGIRQIAFTVDDLSELTKRLKQKGVDITRVRPDGTVSFIRDNSGIVIELLPPGWPPYSTPP